METFLQDGINFVPFHNFEQESVLLNVHKHEIMKDANAAMTLLEKLPERIQPWNGILTHDLCVTGAILHQLSYQSHMRVVVSGFGPLCLVDVILG